MTDIAGKQYGQIALSRLQALEISNPVGKSLPMDNDNYTIIIKAQMLELADGDVGALAVLIELAEYLQGFKKAVTGTVGALYQGFKHISIGDFVGLLEALRIAGAAIWVLFDKLANCNMENFMGILTAVGHTIFSEVDLKESIIKEEWIRPGILEEISNTLHKNFPEYEIKMVY